MVNVGPLTAEICWRLLGTPANFNRFRVMASLLQRRHSMEVNKTLQDVWPSPGLVHYIYIFGGSSLLTEFWQLQKSLCVKLLRSRILPALLQEQRPSAKLCGVAQGMELRNFRRRCHLYSAGRPSRSASAHILVLGSIFFLNSLVLRNARGHCPVPPLSESFDVITVFH